MRQVPLEQIFKNNIDNDSFGKLYLHSMLGRFESWEEISVELKEKMIDKVVCLTSLEEVMHYSPDYANAIENKRLPFEKITIEVPDFGLPNDEGQFAERVKEIAWDLKANESVLVHCAAGIGRTGMFACCLLQVLGLDEHEAISQIKAAGSGPETKEQRDLVARFTNI